MKNLVVVTAGDSSCHEEYAATRDFELWIIYYGSSDQVFERYKASSDRIWRRKGLKIELLRRVLLEELHFRDGFDFRSYDFLLLPDDDIRFPKGACDISASSRFVARSQQMCSNRPFPTSLFHP